MSAATLHAASAHNCGAATARLHAVLEGKGREGKGRDFSTPIHDLPRCSALTMDGGFAAMVGGGRS